ncbi:hypothetical protein JXQ31_14510 [candidate division KSB1 bacterium]|nr:hypothetical protein [candidate division KSB1 bacterium]
MPYKIRNTLFIGIFWLLVMAGGFYYIYGVQAKKYAELQQENKRKTDRLNDLKSMQITRHELIESYTHLKDLSLGKLGALAGNESPGETFDYMLRELNRTSSMIELNQELVDQQKFKDFQRSTYQISGEGNFEDFYELSWFLENGPIFYDIRSINIDRIGAEEKENAERKRGEMTFAVNVWGFQKEKGLDIEQIVRETGQPPNVSNIIQNPVAEAIDRVVLSKQNKASSDYQKNLASSALGDAPTRNPFSNERVIQRNSEGLPEVTPATEILAITPNSVMIRDKSGKIKKLRIGDRVLGGKVGYIDVKAGKVGINLSSAGGGGSLELKLTKK